MKITLLSVRITKVVGKYRLIGLVFFFVNLPVFSQAAVRGLSIKVTDTRNADTSLSTAIQSYLNIHKNNLYYPLSVQRVYTQNDNELLWLNPVAIQKNTSKALTLLGYALQFGLNYADYHPKDLTNEKFSLLAKNFNHLTDLEKVAFDITLTDAMINFLNNLHYGKLNPEYSQEKIDQGFGYQFDAGLFLTSALKINQLDFIYEFSNVQPNLLPYKYLQQQLLINTLLNKDNLKVKSDSDGIKIAINMERLRWIKKNQEKTYIEVNIPSFILQFHQPDTTYQFKVVVGKPNSPTPTLQSAIGYFTTAPEWKIPNKIFRKEILVKALKDVNYLENNHIAIYNNNGLYVTANKNSLLNMKQNTKLYFARQSSGCDNSLGLIVFRFPNIYEVYLHDTPAQELFKKDERAYSHGCIRVEQAEKLADLLLKNDSSNKQIAAVHKAMAQYHTQTFTLKKPVPFNITYITCEVKSGKLIYYKDIYQMDKSLEMALFNMDAALITDL